MTEPTDKVDTPDARQASMSRVVTHDSLMASLAAPASTEPEKEKSEAADKPEGAEQKPKQTANERIRELAAKRKEAEADAEAAKAHARMLEVKLKALEAQAAPIEATARPQRASFANDDDYTDALADWKADQAIARREAQQAQARQQAEFNQVVETWNKRQQKVIDSIPDYAETLAKSEVNINDHVRGALLDSEMGPQIALYLALNPDEAIALNAKRPLPLVKAIAQLEKDLADLDGDAAPAKAEPKAPVPKQTKAPEPISPVKGASAGVASATPPKDFGEYRRWREAQKRQ